MPTCSHGRPPVYCPMTGVRLDRVPAESLTEWVNLADSPQARHLHRIAEQVGEPGVWPSWMPEELRGPLAAAGIPAPWSHQVAAAEAAWSGRHVALSTGTASGKSLGYLLAILAATAADADAEGDWRWDRRRHSALYLAPTKALAHDQLRMSIELGPSGWPVAAIDGDSTPAERDWARDYACYVLTNPDMLHLSMLPNHQRWASFLRTLRFVVVDESHLYRGLFGAQVAAVVRRLRRLAAHYGAEPAFVLASATVGEPQRTAAELIGVDANEVVLIDSDRSARGAVEVLLWQPEDHLDDEAAALLASSVAAGLQTIAFVSSRRSAEIVAMHAQQQLGPAVTRTIGAYRGGYLADDRRALEKALQDGSLHGVAATNALELGIDIAGLDAVIITGFPGTRAAFWQQAGRAGRKGRAATVVLVARKHPVDAYLFGHPDQLFDAPVESAVLRPDNPSVLGPQLAAAAQELPLTLGDVRYFGTDMVSLLSQLEHSQMVRRRPAGWFWTRAERAVDRIDLRASAGEAVDIVEIDTGRLLGHVDPISADSSVHPGAVYLHRGETYLSEELNSDEGEALVRPARPGYLTQPRITAAVSIEGELSFRQLGKGTANFGEVEVASQVTGYLRRDELTGTVWDETPLELPRHVRRTSAVWFTVASALLDEITPNGQLAGGAHAAEHALLGLLPMFAPCDRWDVAGWSDPGSADGELVSIYIHDQHVAGAGFAERGYQKAEDWLRAALERVSSCSCEWGCPACIVSADCGRANQSLDKPTAIRLFQLWAAA
jgi:DEAD/DEAH box helicase domain-containing protein